MQPCETPYTLRAQNIARPQSVYIPAARDTTLHILEFYKRAAAMSSAGKYAAMLSRLPNNVVALVRIVQGLLLPEHAAALYGVTLSEERKREAHVRPVERMLDRLLSHDAQTLSISRRPEHRFVGTSRHFVLLLIAMLRAKGIPARARCGFASFLDPNRFEDHWVCEYWDAAQARWVRVDAQTDAIQQNIFNIDSDLLDVPLHRFVTGGEAWTLCRTGEAHPSQFGISEFNLSGLWLIAGNVVRDVAALNKIEMLPWDQWGAMPASDKPLHEGQLQLFNELAELTHASDALFDELRELYEADHRVRAPAVVFNSIRRRTEAVEEFIRPVFWDDPLPTVARS
jgi:hypothetical protein